MGTFFDLLASNRAIEIAVAYYNGDDRARLARYPQAQRVQEIAGGPIAVPIEEFLTDALFVEKRVEIPQIRAFDAIRNDLNHHLPIFDDGGRPQAKPFGVASG